MKDFILAALPFVLIGISIAVIIVNANKNKSKGKETYICEGMSIGMCFGVTVGSLIPEHLGLFLSLGMLIGEAIGSFIKKNKE